MSKSNYVLGQKPVINRSRSKFPMSYKHLTSFNVGELVPIYIQDILPGDTFKVKSYNVIRTTTPFIKPVMDNLFLDVYYFFVPMRLLWEHTAEFFGENKESFWTQTKVFNIPKITGEVSKNTIADYLGIPPLNYGEDETYFELNALPFRAYAFIWNEWFRDQNLQEPVYIDKGDDLLLFNDNDFSPTNFTGRLAKVNKLHDYFTSCLPAPQKGDTVSLRFGNVSADVDFVSSVNFGGERVLAYGGDALPGGNYSTRLVGDDLDEIVGRTDLSGIDIANVNDLRMAFAMQRLLEKDARGGTRYIEYIAEHFGVINPDYRLQRPEFLGGKRMPLNIQQVASTTESEDISLGELGAYSLSNGVCGFNKGFTEHGFVLGLACVRYKHTYSQGLERFWKQDVRTDLYDPVFANIGEQPVYNYELDVNVDSVEKLNEVFGYNEAWAHYRFKPNRVSADLRPGSNSGLDVYHFADNYNNSPVLGSEFIKETGIFVDRTLSATSSVIPHFIADFYHDVSAIRCMPTYSIPGLIDHK